ncbi:hypothetical protein [Clostridium kluyveri]|uniref:Uncharacterized protein n=2 Tax=Clostridium kluyveri TaxID=1534 RepID=A5N617_CLOK5|nr:hypothetical protein [Clostridium kluyveri]EDK32748.1 Hypothetical protein CKL_0695 [Clostridium kluyveri DSM 555]
MNDKSLNFNIKILFFVAALTAAYFYVDKLEIIALIPLVLCIYDACYIFFKVKNRDGLRVFFIITTVLALIFMIHTVVAYGISNPVPVILIFIMTNLFFIYNLILYFYKRYGKSNLIFIFLGWIICDSTPIVMLFILSAGLSAK